MKSNQHLQSLTLALCVTLSALAFAQAQDQPGIVLDDAVVITPRWKLSTSMTAPSLLGDRRETSW